ncbi:4-alpha-glucanotransferase [Methylomarinum sp. Ch1-1]|uniref:4-alpha-glucanotransferase n=1 Tax=Methylomarinum roseum TaxID=3067653 RepID=A0AAU7NTV4_9GAMM|nr:4-alpha-glucanotransferase [Methylomarinum sp. Ch1-1]MDP4519498.1 4-alpha-glucanotransferase [Methylomarinum sp. Ch1-1]
MSDHLNKRRAGILLHITSLPGAGQCGDLGEEAYNFIRFLHDAGISVWQTLPLGIPHGDGSPYQCMSAHAGNPALISIEWLENKGWLQRTGRAEVSYEGYGLVISNLVRKAFQGFKELATGTEQEDFVSFCSEKAYWLDEFALFYALHKKFGGRSWNHWPEYLKQREPKAIREARKRLSETIEIIKFEQYVFYNQWQELKLFAEQHDVLLFGDIPIFVSYDSADVWANRQAFKLDEEGEMQVVAGVPPDYFSATGQRWGNPHYDWDYLLSTNFRWWRERIKTQDELFDILRIDHFRGLESAWEIPASEDTAINGQWIAAPGHALLKAIKAEYPSLSLVAEDLGVITEEVEALRDDFSLPGMKILQFAFDGGADNPYLPHNCTQNSVVYTGTHDNDTTLGWFNALNDDEKHRVYEYLGFTQTQMPFTLIGTAFASVANLAIVPMQDVLCLGSKFRMNTPGTIEGNWRWRFEWDQLTEEHAGRLKHLVELFGRRCE